MFLIGEKWEKKDIKERCWCHVLDAFPVAVIKHCDKSKLRKIGGGGLSFDGTAPHD